MTTRHTAEPLSTVHIRTGKYAGGIGIRPEAGPAFAILPSGRQDIQEANAARIVACVNACAGMADPEREIAQLRAEVDRLRAWNERMRLIDIADAITDRIGRHGPMLHNAQFWHWDRAFWYAMRAKARLYYAATPMDIPRIDEQIRVATAMIAGHNLRATAEAQAVAAEGYGA